MSDPSSIYAGTSRPRKLGLLGAAPLSSLNKNEINKPARKEKEVDMLALRLDAILIIALFVATSGLAITRLFIRLDRPYLFSFTGSRTRLVILRAVVWLTASLSSVGVCGLLLLALPDFAALAIFFAFEAIMLDICSQRIEFASGSEPVRSPARTSHHGTVTGTL